MSNLAGGQSGSKLKPPPPASTIWVALDEEPLVVGLAVVPVVSLEVPPPPYWPVTKGSHKSLKVHTAVGIGMSMARSLDLIRTYHPIIGMLTVPCLTLFQPAMGFIQHRYFYKTGSKSVFAYLHRWLGRCLMTLGVINAGLGFHLTHIVLSIAPVGAVVAYSVVAGIVGHVYASVVVLLPLRKRRRTHSWKFLGATFVLGTGSLTKRGTTWSQHPIAFTFTVVFLFPCSLLFFPFFILYSLAIILA